MGSDWVLVGVAGCLIGTAVGAWLGVVRVTRRRASALASGPRVRLGRLGERISDTQLHLRLNLWGVAIWLLLLPPTVLLWRESVPYVVSMSWYANFVGNGSAYVAAKAEESIENGNGAVP